MNLNSTATNILVIWYIAGSLIGLTTLALLTIVLIKLAKRLEALENKITPLIDQTSEVLRTVNKSVIQAEPQITSVLSNVASTTEVIADTTETVAAATSRFVKNPVAEVSGIKDALLDTTKRRK